MANDRDPKQMSEDEIVESLFVVITDLKATFAEMEEADLIRLHHTFGQAIRNSYGLWERTPHEGSDHPDEVSMRIMTKIWKRCRGEAV